jgi:hypothetical protein
VEGKILSDRDAEVANFINSQPKDIPSITVKEPRLNLFALPRECEPYTQEYDFRWVSKDSRMMDRAIAKGWIICNRVHNPWLPDYMFAAHGGVEKYNQHLLAFRKKEVSDAIRKRNQEQSIDNINRATKSDEKDRENSPFYTAKLTAEEERTEGGDGLVQGRDF